MRLLERAFWGESGLGGGEGMGEGPQLGANGVWEVEEEESGGVVMIGEGFRADNEDGEGDFGGRVSVGILAEGNAHFCADDKVPVREKREAEFGDFDFV